MHVLFQADQRPKQNHKDVLLLEPGKPSLSDYPLSKKLINLLRHGTLPREDDGAIVFWRIKDYLRNYFVHSRVGSCEKWKSFMERGGGNKNRFQYATDPSGEFLYLRALQSHSGRNLIDLSLQDNVLILVTISSSTFITLDVQSIYIPSSIQD